MREKRIIVAPGVSDEKKVDALSCSDLLVLPSIYESFAGCFLKLGFQVNLLSGPEHQ